MRILRQSRLLTLYYIAHFLVNLTARSLITQNGSSVSHIFAESVRIAPRPYLYIALTPRLPIAQRSDCRLFAVPKKKPSRRRTRIRKTAWMKRFPKHYKRPMMLDMFDIIKYTDGTFTKSRTIHQNWLNLPNTSLDGTHVFTKEVRPSW